MKNKSSLSISLLILLFLTSQIQGQEEATGMPGDHFSLYGALELFKKSQSPEHFEELLNKEDNGVSNLDLNGDGEIDYIMVVDYQEKDAHAIILQVPISKKESQDIAVIALEKTSEESATLQIIGDEEIYGEELVVEPYDEYASSEGKGGPSPEYEVTRVSLNVWLWPSVRFVYRPSYRVYSSPWYWDYYPKWWRPWRPLSWAFYSPRVAHYRVGFRIAPSIRVTNARRVYAPRRTTSVTVVKKYKVNKTTYVKRSNRSVAGSPNKKIAGRRTTSKVATSNGNRTVVGKKSTTKVAASNGKKTLSAKKQTKTMAGARGSKKAVAKKSTKTTKAKKGNKKTVTKTTKKSVRKKKG